MWDGLAVREALLAEYNEGAEKVLSRINALRDGSYKKRALESFVKTYRFGQAVETARRELE